MKYLIFILAFMPLFASAQTLQQEILMKQAELSTLQRLNVSQQAPDMYKAILGMVQASSECVSSGVETKKMFTRVASISKACREQAMLGAFAICSITVAQTGDTRDLNQCTAMMKDDGIWAQVWMRGIGVAGAYAGGKLASDIVLKGAVPLAAAAIAKEPSAPIVVDPVIVDPVIVDPVVVEPIIPTVPF